MKSMFAGIGALMLSGTAVAAPPMGSPLLERAMAEAAVALAQQGSAQEQWTGVGGPEEAAMWPACRPGRGDDRCIQLYEPGVRSAYAAWTAGGARTGMGGPEETNHHAGPASAMSGDATLDPKDESLPRMATSTGHAPEPGDKDAPAIAHPDAAPARDAGAGGADDGARTANEMRAGSARAQYGGLGSEPAYTGVGGPLEEVEPRVYPRCRSRSDDRCQQGR